MAWLIERWFGGVFKLENVSLKQLGGSVL
jgi:hypothetical protein